MFRTLRDVRQSLRAQRHTPQSAAPVDGELLGAGSLELGAWSLEPGAWSLEPGAWSLELGAWSF